MHRVGLKSVRVMNRGRTVRFPSYIQQDAVDQVIGAPILGFIQVFLNIFNTFVLVFHGISNSEVILNSAQNESVGAH